MNNNTTTGDFVPVRLRKENLTELIADSLREAIESGKLLPGQELNQVELANQFGVSRIPVREALIRLEVEGWVESEPNHKTVVAQLTIDGLLELLEIRQVLELLSIEKALAHITRHNAEKVESLLLTAEQPGIALEDWRSLNRDFHTVLCEIAERPKLLAMLDAIHRNVGRYLKLLGVAANRIDEANAEHRAIWQACLEHDASTAQRLLRQHIAGTMHALSKAARTESKSGSESHD